jgi:hypothetical protein
MLKKTIKYENFLGIEVEEDFYFNYTLAEIASMKLREAGGIEAKLQKIVNTKDQPKLFELFTDLILNAYGEISPDGKRFIKSKELSEAFSQTEAFSQLFMELLGDEKAAADFVTACMPASIQAEMIKQAKQTTRKTTKKLTNEKAS